MSPFAHFLHDLRMRRNVRQADLAELMGYEQSYISALEVGLKGPPTPEFLSRLVAALSLSSGEQAQLRLAADASQRKLVLDPDMPEDIFWLLKDLRDQVDSLTPTHVRMIRDLMRMNPTGDDAQREPVRRLKRRSRQEATM